MDLIATSFIKPDGSVPTLHVTTWRSQRILLPYSKKFEYRLLRIFVYDFVTARSVFVNQTQRLREMRKVKRKRTVLF